MATLIKESIVTIIFWFCCLTLKLPYWDFWDQNFITVFLQKLGWVQACKHSYTPLTLWIWTFLYDGHTVCSVSFRKEGNPKIPSLISLFDCDQVINLVTYLKIILPLPLQELRNQISHHKLTAKRQFNPILSFLHVVIRVSIHGKFS